MKKELTTPLRISREGYPSFLEWLKKLSETEKKTLTRHLARTDLYFLLRYCLFRKDLDHPWLFDRCREVQESPDGHLDLWAREHYKSTIITFGKTIQDILASHGDDPIIPYEATISIFSHTRPIAKGFLRQIKQEFERNILLYRLFPDILYAKPQKSALKWSEDEGIIVKRKGNPKEATVEAWGVVDGQPTSKHFTHLIYDDVVVPASVTTPEMIQKTTDALGLSFNLGSEGGIRRFIGTYYHFNDSYHALQNRGSVAPRIKACTHDGTETGKPVLMSAESVTNKRRDMGPYIFSCQMLLNPKGDETQGFKREWLKYHDGVSHHNLNCYLLFDPANEKKKTSDYTAGFAVGLGADKNVYVLNIIRDRLNLTQRADRVFEWHAAYEPKQVRYEKYGKDADINHFQDRMKRDVYHFDLTEVGGSTSKADRIKRLIPYFEQGRIYLPKTLYYTDYEGKTKDLVHEFIEQEYMGFPVPVHDDLLDALARLFEPDLDLIWPKPKKKAKRSGSSPPLDPYT